LPYCTSWRQGGANELCTSPLDAYPGAPSKCNCDAGFTVPINVPAASLGVVKNADPDSVGEGGQNVTFTVELTNNTVDPDNDVILDASDCVNAPQDGLCDSVYGDIRTPDKNGENNKIISTTCGNVSTIQPGAENAVTCSFVAFVSGSADDTTGETDTVYASGLDQYEQDVRGSDSATVTYTNVDPVIAVTKDADPTSIDEGADATVTFSVLIENNSNPNDTVTLNSLLDSPYGNLLDAGNANVSNNTCPALAGASIPPGSSESCSFDATVPAGNVGDTSTDEVTAKATDEEGIEASDSDTATVTYDNVDPAASLVKNVVSAVVTYQVVVTNDSTAEPMYLTELMDDQYGDITQVQGDIVSTTCSVGTAEVPTEIAVSGKYTCTFSATVSAEDEQPFVDKVTGQVRDDELKFVDPAPSDTASLTLQSEPSATQ